MHTCGFLTPLSDTLMQGMMILSPVLLICMIVSFVRSKGKPWLRVLCVIGAIVCVLFIALDIWLAVTAGTNARPPQAIG